MVGSKDKLNTIHEKVKIYYDQYYNVELGLPNAEKSH